MNVTRDINLTIADMYFSMRRTIVASNPYEDFAGEMLSNDFALLRCRSLIEQEFWRPNETI